MKTTLQARLINLLMLLSLFLVSAFTAIQLNNQIGKTREFNIYQARLEAISARDRLQSIFSTSALTIAPSTAKSGPASMLAAEQRSHTSVIADTKSLLNSILETGVIKTAAVLDTEGVPVILEGNLSLFFEEDKDFIKSLSQSEDKSKWLVPRIDKEHKLTNLYVRFENPYGYTLKLTFSLSSFQEALNAVYVPVIFIVVIVAVGNIVLGILLSSMIIKPIGILNHATKDVAGGNLEVKIDINTKDELEELANTFNYMTVELKKMKEKAENANPLTKLPGNIVIQDEVNKRLAAGAKFSLIYCDLDNFKAFNDKYGVHAGDKAIMLTANIFKEAVAKIGHGQDFVGHEGGDDFLVLTTPECVNQTAEYIIQEFDKRIRELYSKEDLDKGYIEAPSRQGNEILKYPIMTISLAGVSNAHREIESYAHVTNIAAEMKKVAKKQSGSKFVMDKRKMDLGKEFRNV